MTPQERRQYVARRRVEGATLKVIADELGVTKQRAHQLASDVPAPCRCGCGGEIPVGTPGLRAYIGGHEPNPRCPDCGESVAREGNRCPDCSTPAAEDKTGKTFGRLTVTGLVTPQKSHPRRWWCRCACGRENAVWAMNLVGGLSNQCRACGYTNRTRHD